MAPSGARTRTVSRSRTIHSSGDALPETSRSPRPRTALTTHSSRLPVTGLAVKATPAASACTSSLSRTSKLALKAWPFGILVGRRSGAECGRPARLNRRDELVEAAHAKDGFVLPGKRSARQILGDARRSNGERHAAPWWRSRTECVLDIRWHSGGSDRFQRAVGAE